MGDVIKELRTRYDVPMFAAGDFNSGKSTEQIALFKDVCGLTLLSPSTGVDHIFGESSIEVVAGGIERSNCAQYASDHKPVWIDCNIKAS
jgi:endonuclease/exonuclease/phosphatase family metal-dependent hydrolase